MFGDPDVEGGPATQPTRRLVYATRGDVEYARYAERDRLCCPSGKTYVGFQVLNGPDGSIVVTTHARTESMVGEQPR